ncbi:hypothetical protein CEXT_461761 [Caerostris extrusa]|uniref:Uncharacterized protein n=1 Tax=Caerostris extrusa TaxID=172846 RepID=A0AAV4QSM1_CAEEX|nr:hypothetical protein CEXT_461761 [Caerostris extrusa]
MNLKDSNEIVKFGLILSSPTPVLVAPPPLPPTPSSRHARRALDPPRPGGRPRGRPAGAAAAAEEAGAAAGAARRLRGHLRPLRGQGRTREGARVPPQQVLHEGQRALLRGGHPRPRRRRHGQAARTRVAPQEHGLHSLGQG